MTRLLFLTVALVASFLIPTGATPASFDLQTPLSSSNCGHDATISKVKPKDFIKAFNNLTIQLTGLIEPTNDLTMKNAFLVVAGEGPFPILLEGVVKFIDSAEGFISKLDGAKPIKDGKNSDNVLAAYSATSKAALFWANVFSSKSNGFRGSDIFKPVGALGESALRGMLEVLEVLAFFITDYLPDELADVQQEASALSRGFNQAIIHYNLIKLGSL